MTIQVEEARDPNVSGGPVASNPRPPCLTPRGHECPAGGSAGVWVGSPAIKGQPGFRVLQSVLPGAGTRPGDRVRETVAEGERATACSGRMSQSRSRSGVASSACPQTHSDRQPHEGPGAMQMQEAGPALCLPPGGHLAGSQETQVTQAPGPLSHLRCHRTGRRGGWSPGRLCQEGPSWVGKGFTGLPLVTHRGIHHGAHRKTELNL